MHESIPATLPKPLITNSHILPTWNDEPLLCVTPEKKPNNKDKLSKSVRFNSFIDTNFIDKENDTEAEHNIISCQDVDGSFLQTVKINSSQLLCSKFDKLAVSKNTEEIGNAVKKKLAQSSQLRSTINDMSSVKLNAPNKCQKYANLVPLQMCKQSLIEQREMLIADSKSNARSSSPTTTTHNREPAPTLENYYKDFGCDPEYLCFPEENPDNEPTIGLETVSSYRAFDLILHQRHWENLL